MALLRQFERNLKRLLVCAALPALGAALVLAVLLGAGKLGDGSLTAPAALAELGSLQRWTVLGLALYALLACALARWAYRDLLAPDQPGLLEKALAQGVASLHMLHSSKNSSQTKDAPQAAPLATIHLVASNPQPCSRNPAPDWTRARIVPASQGQKGGERQAAPVALVGINGGAAPGKHR